MSKQFPFSLDNLLDVFLRCDLNVVSVKLLPNVSVVPFDPSGCGVLEVEEIQEDSGGVTHLCSTFWTFLDGKFRMVDPSFKTSLMEDNQI